MASRSRSGHLRAARWPRTARRLQPAPTWTAPIGPAEREGHLWSPRTTPRGPTASWRCSSRPSWRSRSSSPSCGAPAPDAAPAVDVPHADASIAGTPVTVGTDVCGSGWTGAKAGRETFAVWNNSNQGLEVYLQDASSGKCVPRRREPRFDRFTVPQSVDPGRRSLPVLLPPPLRDADHACRTGPRRSAGPSPAETHPGPGPDHRQPARRRRWSSTSAGSAAACRYWPAAGAGPGCRRPTPERDCREERLADRAHDLRDARGGVRRLR